MKNAVLFFMIFIFTSLNVEGQNILQNGDFETFSSLPTNSGQIERATPWIRVIRTPDYAHALGYGGVNWAPHNGGAFAGQGFMGMVTTNGIGGAEAITQDISANPIERGRFYEIGFAHKNSNAPAFDNCECKFEIWGMNQLPDYRISAHISQYIGAVRLWQSANLTDENWSTTTGNFTAPDDFNFVVVSLDICPVGIEFLYIDELYIRAGSPPIQALPPDIFVCGDSTFTLDVTNQGGTYLWQDGSTLPTFEVSTPGTYSVQITLGSQVVTDSIKVVFENNPQPDLGVDQSICVGDTLRLQSAIFDNYKWSTIDLNGCNDCQFFDLEVSQDTQIILEVSSNLGCSGRDSITISAIAPVTEFQQISLCANDSVLINGAFVFSDTLLSQNLTSSFGCDSILTTAVVFSDTIFQKESFEFCAGDTVFISGLPISKDTILTQIFNQQNGCDSTVEVSLKFRPPLLGTERLEFCEGDTVMIFGNEVTDDVTLSEVFISSNGCDSTATIKIIFNQKSFSNEALKFCAGDTANIFGLEISRDTIVSETLSNSIGCDSLHTVEVVFNQAIQTNDSQTFCEGDTAKVFGLSILRDTIVSQILPSSGGCDSTHTIEIIFNQTIQTFEQLEFCAGDTAFVFGNAVTQDDTISQIFNSAIGCDSTHNVDIIFLAEAEKMISESLCENDILLFFNDTISETGTYFKTIPSIDNGCDTNYVLTAEFFENPTFTLVTDTLISIGESFEIPLNISDPTAQVVWQSNPLLSCENCLNPIATISEATTFEAIITNAQGCSVVARINVRVVDDNGIYIPSAFSPNGDFNNDVFTVFSKEAKQIDQLQIFDRWGGILFELNEFMSNEPSIGWDGTSRNLPVNSGVYVYKFLIRDDDGKQEMFAGDVTVIR